MIEDQNKEYHNHIRSEFIERKINNKNYQTFLPNRSKKTISWSLFLSLNQYLYLNLCQGIIFVQNNITTLYYFNNKMDSDCLVSPSGTANSPLDPEPIRSNKYSAPFLFNSRYSTSILDPKVLAEETQTLLQAICMKFSFTEETLALGIHFFQTLRHMNSHEKFWASSCLIVAGKAC